jgi:hypothetical protein
MRRTALLLAGLALSGATAARADQRLCAGVGLDEAPVPRLGRIKADAGKVFFLTNGSAQNSCPSAAPECLEKAYVVAGDLVVLGLSHGDYVCADYDGGKGDRGGWLPSAAIEPAPMQSDPAAWLGKWKRIEAEIRIEKKSDGLKAEGDATFGALDPARVHRGGVNVGDFSGALVVKDGLATIADQDADPKDSFGCKVWLARSGIFLYVRDNGQCGGFNVSFSGLYRRTAK